MQEPRRKRTRSKNGKNRNSNVPSFDGVKEDSPDVAVANTLMSSIQLVGRRPALFTGVAFLLGSRLITAGMMEIAKSIKQTKIEINVSGLDGLEEATRNLESTLRAIMLKEEKDKAEEYYDDACGDIEMDAEG